MNPFPASARPVLLVYILLGAGGCDLVESDEFREHERRLNRAEARWAAVGPTEYRMVYQRGCFCTPDILRPVELRVTEAGVEERRFVDSGEPVPEEIATAFLHVPRIFEAIRDAIRARPDEFRAEYDPVLGYPVELFTDYRVTVADGWMSHRVLELVAEP